MIGSIIRISSITCSASGRELVRRTSLLMKIEEEVRKVNIFSRESLKEEKEKAEALLLGAHLRIRSHMEMKNKEETCIRAEVKECFFEENTPNHLSPSPPINPYATIKEYSKAKKEEKEKLSLGVVIKRKILRGRKEVLQCVDKEKSFCEILLNRYIERNTFTSNSLILLTNIQEVLPDERYYTEEYSIFLATSNTLIESLPLLKEHAFLQSIPSPEKKRVASIRELQEVKEEGVIVFEGRIIKVSPAIGRIAVADRTGGVYINLPEEERRFFRRLEEYSASSLLPEKSPLFSKIRIQCTVLLLNKRLVPQDIVIQNDE